MYARSLWLFYQHLNVPDIYELFSEQFFVLAETEENVDYRKQWILH